MSNKNTFQFSSPAKLNLFLHIVGQKENGYHELETVFQFLDYGDSLIIEPTKKPAIELVDNIAGVAKEDNLIYKAAKLLQTTHKVERGAKIGIKKILPMGGGLGGGSSNAATVLCALNLLWDLNLSNQQLQTLGVQLGADVPIFIYGLSAFAKGIGEQLAAVEPETPWYLISKPNVSISTKDVFTAKALKRDTDKIISLSDDLDNYHNDCQSYVINHYPEVANLLAWLIEYAPSKMTGTGACIFSRFESREKAEQVQELLPAGIESFVAKGTNCSPLFADLAAANSQLALTRESCVK